MSGPAAEAKLEVDVLALLIAKELERIRRLVVRSPAFAEVLRARPGVSPGEVYGEILAQAVNGD